MGMIHRVLFATLSLLAATSAAEATRAPLMCTMEYRPVCGWKAGRWQTYPNRCHAIAARAGRVTPGECRAGRR